MKIVIGGYYLETINKVHKISSMKSGHVYYITLNQNGAVVAAGDCSLEKFIEKTVYRVRPNR